MTEQITRFDSEQQATGKDGSMKSRRRILQVGAALAAGALATTIVDRDDAKAAGTISAQSNDGVAAVTAYNSSSGPGVWGRSLIGVGVWGTAEQNDGDGVVGFAAETGRGVAGHSVDGTGVEATSEAGNAIRATADNNIAISARSPNWTAINGSSDIDTGVRGVSLDGVGVRGESQGNDGVSGESDQGYGVHGESWHSDGVYGRSVEEYGVRGTSSHAAGVRGESTDAPGVVGHSDSDVGVFGSSGSAAGVRGYSNDKIGVEGISPYATGVDGYSVDSIGVKGHSFYGIGVLAEAHDAKGRALQVQGRAHFETAGNAVIPAGTDNVFVNEPLTTATSHVSASLMGHPSPGGNRPPTILYVERKPDVGFTVYLTGRVEVDTPVSFLVVEPIAQKISVEPVRG